MTTTIIRKADTREPGNAGEFGTRFRAEATVTLDRTGRMAEALGTLGNHIAATYPGATDIDFDWDDDNGVLIPNAVYVDDEEAWSWVGSRTTAEDRRTSDLAAIAAARFSTGADPDALGLSRTDTGFRYTIAAD
jgi:hypothetical protein